MNNEEAKHWLPLITALTQGRLEFNVVGIWVTCDKINFDLRSTDYRIKPKPKYRPYESIGEIPIGATVMAKGNSQHTGIITGVNGTPGFYKISIGAGKQRTPEELFANYTFTNGEPCGIEL